jgi:uncharacterized membrane protein YfcA
MPGTHAFPPLLLCFFAFLAGFVDAIAGGGGLIQLPALMILLPAEPILAIIGTNKMVAMFGTTFAAGRFARSIKLDWHVLAPATATAFVFSAIGSGVAASFNPNLLKPVVLCLLIVAAIYVYVVKDIGLEHKPRHSKAHGLWWGVLVGAVLGFYDGFFGPGSGSFLILIFASFFGYEFLAASGCSKVINLATNLASVSYYVWIGQVLYWIALPLAISNTLGAMAGSHLAILKGSKFVRVFFLFIVAGLIAKLGHDMMQPGAISPASTAPAASATPR